jgi:hypothetical protein
VPNSNPRGDKAAVELDVVLEPMPKWSEVQRILAEIKSEVQGKQGVFWKQERGETMNEEEAPAAAASAGTATTTETTTVLIAVKHQSTASQLAQVIRLGIDAVMSGIFERYVPPLTSWSGSRPMPEFAVVVTSHDDGAEGVQVPARAQQSA